MFGKVQGIQFCWTLRKKENKRDEVEEVVGDQLIKDNADWFGLQPVR